MYKVISSILISIVWTTLAHATVAPEWSCTTQSHGRITVAYTPEGPVLHYGQDDITKTFIVSHVEGKSDVLYGEEEGFKYYRFSYHDSRGTPLDWVVFDGQRPDTDHYQGLLIYANGSNVLWDQCEGTVSTPLMRDLSIALDSARAIDHYGYN